MSTKLNQLIAIEKGAKPQANADVAAAYQRVGKADLLAGISRTYRPLDDMGEELPAESKRVQVRVREVIANVKNPLTRLFDVTATSTATCRPSAKPSHTDQPPAAQTTQYSSGASGSRSGRCVPPRSCRWKL
ncbi:hypothetical protein ACIBEK_08615 [Nocardia fusca]|uniref:DUF7873 family protein n=1 Tax=Nocardia fusca TaxID=941183 RepID=UPI0037A66939